MQVQQLDTSVQILFEIPFSHCSATYLDTCMPNIGRMRISTLFLLDSITFRIRYRVLSQPTNRLISKLVSYPKSPSRVRLRISDSAWVPLHPL